MKKKLISSVLIGLVISMSLTACNPVETIKSKFGKGDSEEEVLPTVGISVNDSLLCEVGQIITADDIVLEYPTDKVVSEVTLMDEGGIPYTEYEVMDVATLTVVVTYIDGTEDTASCNIMIDVPISTEPTEDVDTVEFPQDWQDRVETGKYILTSYVTGYGDTVWYLKANVNVLDSSGSFDDVEFERINYNEESGFSMDTSYMSQWYNSYKATAEMMEGLSSMMAVESEEEFNAMVEDGSLEVEDGMTYEEYLAALDSFSNSAGRVNEETETINVNGKEVTMVTTSINYGSLLGYEGIEPMWVNTTAYTVLPSGGIIAVSISDLSNSVTEMEEAPTEEQLKSITDSANSKIASAKELAQREIKFVSTEDYSTYVGQTPVPLPDDFPVGVGDDGGVEEMIEELPTDVIESSSSTTTTTTTTTTMTTGTSVATGASFAEKYPSLFEWPDQQQIYGLEPKRIVYDVLSVTDTQGAVEFETCLIPMWATNERKFLNTMDFTSAAGNRQEAVTPVVQAPSQSSTGSGLFASSGGNQSSASDEEQVNPDDLPSAILQTSFGQFKVKSTEMATVDTNRSTKSQVYLKDDANVGYRVMGTTIASIEKNRSTCIYDIADANMSTWKCVTGSQETTPLGIITRYYMTYEDNQAEKHTCEYMYTINGSAGYIMVLCDQTPTTVFSTMYAICKSIEEVE